MWFFNTVLSSAFDVLLTPFHFLHPFWPLLLFSLLTAILTLFIFRFTSNQEEIKQVKNLAKAYWLELSIFKDNLGILFSAQKHILLYSAKYSKYSLKPLLFTIVPVAIILIQLEGWFAYRPLKPGESTTVSVKVSDPGEEILSSISMTTTQGLRVETPPLRIRAAMEVDWRVRAIASGEHELVFNVSGQVFRKKVIITEGKLARVSPRVFASSPVTTILNPGERPLAKGSSVRQIEVDYPSRSIEIFGWSIHWILLFFFLSITIGAVMTRFLWVEI